MDLFTRQTARSIGPGGLKCPCCTDYRTFGNNAGQKHGLNQLRRTRLKRSDSKMLNRFLGNNAALTGPTVWLAQNSGAFSAPVE